MSQHYSHHLKCALSASLVTLACSGSIYSATVQSNDPPSTWYGFAGGSVAKKKFSNGYFADAVPVPTSSKVIVRYRTPTPPSPDAAITPWADPQVRSTNSDFATRYWPVDYEWVEGTEKALVVGVMPGAAGVLVFEEWQFSSTVLPTLVNSLEPNTGASVATWVTPPRQAVTLMHSATSTQLGVPGMPSFVIENKALADEDRYFMGFRGDPRIYHLDLENDSAWCAAHPTDPSGGALVVAHLELDDWQACRGTVHSDGFVYSVYNVYNNMKEMVHLIDSDQDGELDSWQRFTDAAPSIKYGPRDTEVISRF
ncbi:MAG: hypothetical protein GY722_05020 [bacterium]|nr:hypothetical protein [bacterium]